MHTTSYEQHKGDASQFLNDLVGMFAFVMLVGSLDSSPNPNSHHSHEYLS